MALKRIKLKGTSYDINDSRITGVANNVTTTSEGYVLDARQGKVLKDLVDTKTSNVGTITGIKMNGSSKGTSGVVDLGTVITSHQDISGKVDNTTAGGSELLNKLGEGTSTPQDADYYISQYAGGGTTTTTYHRRPMSALWNYIKSKLSSVATSGSYNDLSNKPTIGSGTITVTQNGTTKATFTVNQTGNTTVALTDTNTTYGVATTSANGLMSSTDKSKLDGIAAGAEVNQNAFSNVIVGSTTVAADTKTDSLTLVGSNVTLTPDATNDKVTIGITKANVTSALGYTPPTTNTTYSEATTSAAGLMSASDKSKLNGIAAGAQVNTITGVKGNAESSYRTGNVNITPANVGAIASSEKGAASGVVPLNSSSLIDSKYLPSYVDDVLEYASKDKFPTTGEAGKIYVDTSVEENNTYRWSGTTYILIAKNTNTTYKLTKSGSTITLTGSDGATTSVADSNTTYSNATTSAAGLMSASDKSKLDGIASGANAYTLPTATSSVLGGVKTGSNITNSSGTISLTKANVTAALGYTPPTTNTTYSTGTATTSGLTKLYTGTGTATDGTMTQSAINTALSGKAASSHNHDSTYLKLSGGTITGKINRSAGGSWISARDNVAVNGTATGTDSFNTVVGQKTPNGHWAIGNLGSSENLTFAYSTDTNYNAGTNSTTNITLPNTAGTLALTSQIPSVGNGTVTVTQGGTTKGTFTMNQSGNTTIALTDNNTTYSAGTGISLSGTTFSNSGVRSIATGGSNGTISVNTNGTTANVAVKGLGSAAYTASTAYAAASHTHTKSQITDFPTIPTVNNPTITITQAGTTKGTFTLNQSGNATIALTDNNTTYSNATTSTAGLMSAADKAKLDGITGTSALVKYVGSITGTGSATSFTVTHSLGTKDVMVQVYNSSGEAVLVDVTRSSTSAIAITFNTAPTTSETFKVLILGLVTSSSSSTSVTKYAASITGTGSATSFAIGHGLNTKDVMVQVYNSSGETVEVDTTRNATDTVTITFNTAPATSETFRVVVLGL